MFLPSAGSPSAPPLHLVDTVAEAIAAAHQLDESPSQPSAATIIRARGAGEDIDLGLMTLPDGCHPAEALAGMTVPPEWTAVGVVASGRAHPLDGRRATAVRVIAVVDRDGRAAHRLIGAPSAWGQGQLPPEGLLMDLLRRSLGLATPAPVEPPSEWWDQVWLDRLVAAAAVDPSRVASIAAARTLHPWPGRATPSWVAIHRAASHPDGGALAAALEPHIDAPLARWHDTGSLARWLLGSAPPIAALLDALDALAPSEVAAAVRDACAPDLERPARRPA